MSEKKVVSEYEIEGSISLAEALKKDYRIKRSIKIKGKCMWLDRGNYPIEFSTVKTYADVMWWIYHLNAKVWFNSYTCSEFIILCSKINGWGMCGDENSSPESALKWGYK